MSDLLARYQALLDQGLSSTAALEHMARDYGLDPATIRRNLTRADKRWRTRRAHTTPGRAAA